MLRRRAHELVWSKRQQDEERAMTERPLPPFRADHVGSLLRPPALLAERERRRRGEITAEDLRRVEDAAIREVVALQEEIGLQVVTDGEFRRTLWHMDFLTQFANVAVARSAVKVNFHTAAGDIQREPSALRITGRLARPHPIFVDHFAFLKSIARASPEADDPVAQHPAFPRRPRRDRRAGLSRDGRVLRRSRTRLQRGGARPRRQPAAAICSSTRSISPISAIPSCAARCRTSARIRRRCRIPTQG